MLEKLLASMLAQLSTYKHGRDDLMLFYVNERLNKSLESYTEDLRVSETYLNNRKELNLLRKINRAYD